MLVTKQIEIDMGHRVPNHKSKCRNLHGHRYKIEVGVDDKVVAVQGRSDEGMVIDFGDLKEVMMKTLDRQFDHSFMMYDEDEYAGFFDTLRTDGQKINFVPFVPTAENLAMYFYNLMKVELIQKKILISYVKIWETPTSTAIYGM